MLAGGSGTRLYPVTRAVSKQLLPLYDKPLVYYPLATLMLAGIRDILLIATPEDGRCSSACSATARSGVFACATPPRPQPGGIAQALLIGERLHRRPAGVPGARRQPLLWTRAAGAAARGRGAMTAARRCSPTTCAIPSATASWSSITCRPRDRPRGEAAAARSHYAVTGLYFYDAGCVADRAAAHALRPRRAGDHRRQPRLSRAGTLRVEVLGRGVAWLDTGTHDRCWRRPISSRPSSRDRD